MLAIQHCNYSRCDLEATKRCSGCKTTYYCSREHQILDWKEGKHKEICRKIHSVAFDSSQGTQNTRSAKSEERAYKIPPVSVGIHALKSVIVSSPATDWAYAKLAVAISNEGEIDIEGVNWSCIKLMVKAINLNPRKAGYYCVLHHMLPKDGMVRINDKDWFPVDLLRKTIELDPGRPDTYFYLISFVPEPFVPSTEANPYGPPIPVQKPHGSININGVDWTVVDLIGKAIELDVRFAKYNYAPKSIDFEYKWD